MGVDDVGEEIGALHRAWWSLLVEGDLDGARGLLARLPESLAADAPGENGGTLLITSSGAGRLDFCEVLLAAGADPSLRDHFGRCAAAVFASECGRQGRFHDPGSEARASASRLFAAYGTAAGRLPRRYRLRFDVEMGDGKALGRFWAAALRGGSAPRPLADPSNPRRGRIWLLAEEVTGKRSLLTQAALNAGLAGTFSLRAES